MNALMTVPLECKALEDAPGLFEGYGAVFGNIDNGLDVIERGAFADSLAQHKADGTMPSMYWYHNDREPVGEWLEMREDERGLYVKGQLWVEGIEGRDPIERSKMVRNQILSRGSKGLSIGYTVANGGQRKETRDGMPVRILSKLDLAEVSPVMRPMNDKAGILSAKSISPRNLEHALREELSLSRNEAKEFVTRVFGRWDDDQDSDQRDAEKAQRDAEINAMIQSLKAQTETLNQARKVLS